jgi:hypothetical protein
VVPARRTTAAEQFDSRNVPVKLLQTETRLGWLLAVLTEWAVDYLLDAGALAFKPIPLVAISMSSVLARV